MTRAKSRLEIHYNDDYLKNIRAENIVHVADNTIYPSPDELSVQTTHKHVQLGYFAFVQKRILSLKSADLLKVNEEGCLNHKEEQVLKFSAHMKEEIQKLQQLGYSPAAAKVTFLLYWYSEERDKEFLVVLPEITFLKKTGKPL
ncbi:MAG: hypothetical protein WD577_10080 [Bacteroidales bacterium]